MRLSTKRLIRAVALVFVLTLFPAGVATADDILPDGDGTAPVASSTLAFGDVCVNQTTEDNALLAIKRNWDDAAGSNDSLRVFGNSSLITVTVFSTGHAALSATMAADTTITLPSDWLDTNVWAKGDIYQDDTAEVDISVTPTVLGNPGSQVVTLNANGLNAFGSAINRRIETVKVTWNAVSCATYQPDARIKRSGGPLRGVDVYNTTGEGQTVALTPPAGSLRRVYLTVRNRGDAPDSFSLQTTGVTPDGYELRYFLGRTDVELTAAVEADTLVTPVMAPGRVYRIRIRVVTTFDADPGSTLTRLFTFTSQNDGSKQDAAKLTVSRQ